MYLIIPSLIPQPTWGGSFITKLKNINNSSEFFALKIGQSFELSGKSLLSLTATDSSSEQLEVVLANTSGVIQSPLKNRSMPLRELVAQDPAGILGSEVAKQYHNTMPLLIKLNQAVGNSFQLHIKPGQIDKRWMAKPESWYFFENGTITCGLKKGSDVSEYKKCCLEIDRHMGVLSDKVKKGDISIIQARKEASGFIYQLNPWQFVNKYDISKDSVVDLSAGGITHSWEENPENTEGNIIYEVQMDVADDRCTIRAFDQGKITEDGSVREIHIDDYFKYIEDGEVENDIASLLHVRSRSIGAIKTQYYQMDVITYSGTTSEVTENSYQHLFVKYGAMQIVAGKRMLTVRQGHSCFIPCNTKTYTIEPLINQTVVLRTHQSLS